MDTQLFMECEEEELEPWQQLDDSVEEEEEEEEEMDFMANCCEPVEDCPSPLPASESPPPRTPPTTPVSTDSLPVRIVSSSLALPPLPPTPVVTSVTRLAAPSTSTGSAAPLMAQGPPLILTQTASGTYLFPAAPGAGGAPSILLTTQMTNVDTFRFEDQRGRTFESKGEMVTCGACGGKYFRIVSHLKKSRTCSSHLDLDKFEKLLILYNRKRKRKCVTKGLPVQTAVNPGPPLLLNLQPGQTARPLALIQSSTLSQLSQGSAPSGGPAPPGSALTTTRIPATLTIRTSTPGPFNLQMSKVGGANALKLTDSPALSSLSPNGVTRLAVISSSASRPMINTASVATAPGATSDPPRVVMSVEEFYYGTFEGDLSLRKPQPLGIKTSTFTCQICTHLAENNLRLMRHMLQHSELITGCDAEEKFCRFCYRQFSSSLQLHTHQEQVHGSAPSSSMCRICEWAFEDEPSFLNHMKSNHRPGEMPYICQVCSFCSSFYADVLQHFDSFHSHSGFLLCVFCLKVTRNPVTYQQHLLSHQVSQAFHCNRCRLQFVFLKDKTQHKLQNHRSFRRPARLAGLPPGSKVTIRTYGKFRPLMTSAGAGRLLQTSSSLVQPIHVKTEPQKPPIQGNLELSRPPRSPTEGVRRMSCDRGALVCMECGTDASDFSSHFPSNVHCLLCPYSSCCSRAYAAHMIHHHVPRSKDGWVPLHRLPPPCPFLLRCSECDFRPQSSDLMAHHLLTHPEHRSATCVLRTYIEPDIQFSPGDKQPPSDQDQDRLDPAWRSASCWKQPMVAGSTVLPFRHASGPRHLPAQNSDAIDFFNLLFPARLVELIVNETNGHAKTCRFLGSSPSDWRPVTTHEVKGFIGLVVLMGIHNLPNQSHYWSWSHYDNSYTFDQTMSFRRFKQIASMIRMGSFTTDQHRGTQNSRDPLHIFRPMLDVLGGAMWGAYSPNCCLTVDRALLPRPEEQGGAGNPQTQPQVWLLCDSKSGYCHRFFIQVGEEAEPGFTVVPELVKGLEDKQHQLYLASCLTSVPLVQKLLDQGIYASSSFARHSPVLPTTLWRDGPLDRPGDFVQKQFGGLLATRWRDTKETGCLSTNAAPGGGDTVWRRSQTKGGGLAPINRPMAFRLLQENMRGVDICKQLLACNPLGGLAQDRHWRSLFWFLVNLSIVNAFILLRESRKDNPPVWVQDGLFTQLNFRKRLANQLAMCAQEKCKVLDMAGSRPPSAEPVDPVFSTRHRMAKISALSKRCRNCNSKNIRRETVYGCFSCKVNLCKEPDCFWEFHGLSPLHKGPTKVGFLKDGEVSGAVEVDEVQRVEGMAPVEDMDFSEEEPVADLDEVEEESINVEKNAVSPPSAANLHVPLATVPFPPREREDFLSARQLRIAMFALCDGLRQASRVFSTETQLIRSWLREARRRVKQREQQENLPGDGDGRMVAWVLSMREQQLPITETALFHKASTLKKKGCFCESFRISYDWAVSFLLRHRLGVRSLGSATPTYALPTFLDSRVAAFRQFTRKVVRVHRLPESRVAAMDELCLFVDLRLVQDKARRSEALELMGSLPLVTVYLAALADGTVLPSLVLSNRQLVEKLPSESVLLEAGPESLSLQDALDLWTNKVWVPHLSLRSQPGRSVLVLDRHRDHAGDRLLASLGGTGTLPALIPAGCASRLQPLEVCVKPALQRFMLLRWNHFTAGNHPELEDTSPQRLQANVAQLLVDWLVEALMHLNQVPQVWKDSFRMSGLLLQEEEAKENPQSVQLELLQSLTNTLLTAANLENKAPEAVELEDEEEEETEEEQEEEKTEDEATQEEKEKKEEEDIKEKGKEAERNEQRETRIVTGEEVGDEWKIKSRTEGEDQS